MKFYDTLQLDTGVLKNKIQQAATAKERNYFICSLLTKDILLVGFAMFFISTLSTLFGDENANMAIVLFCILLSVRFVDFDYRIGDSLINLFLIFSILLVSPLVIQDVSPLTGFVVNFFSIITILVMTSERPEMGNSGLYMFGYIFLTGSSVSSHAFANRSLMVFLCYLCCALVFFIKHGKKHMQKSFKMVLKDFNLRTVKSQWQFKITLGISFLFIFRNLLGIHHFMWIGFACSTLLSIYPSTVDIRTRVVDRLVGIIAGSVLFGIVYSFTPASMQVLFGPISGLCLGLCATYRYKTLCNCFGALLLAAATYGLQGAVSLRIVNNLTGLCFGIVFLFVYQRILQHILTSSNVENGI